MAKVLCRPLFPTISGGHVLSLANQSISLQGLHPMGLLMSKTSAKPVTRPVALEQSTSINWFLPTTQPPFNPR